MDTEFEERSDENDAICPYCGNKYQVETEDYDEDCRQEKCDECGNNYWLNQTFSVTHDTRADCSINGQDHIYERVTFKDGKKADFCTKCGDCSLVGYN